MMNVVPVEEITAGIRDFDFGNGLDQLGFSTASHQLLRKKSHLKLAYSCAHATFFVGIANRIRRNVEEIKSGAVRQKNSILINQVRKTPGLQIGIIGAGKLGKHLAKCLLEYAEVYPNELQISTRQPDSLVEFDQLNVKCYFDNAKIAQSVNILFICVLPAQLGEVMKDLKTNIHEQCIVFSFTTAVSTLNLRNYLGASASKDYIIRPVYNFHKSLDKFDQKLADYWTFSATAVDALKTKEAIILTNMFTNEQESILSISDMDKCALIYSFVNMCTFMGLSRPETIIALRNYVFRPLNDNFKLDEANFFNPNEIENDIKHYPLVNLSEISIFSKQTPLLSKLQQSKSFVRCLSRNYIDFFVEAIAWRKNKS